MFRDKRQIYLAWEHGRCRRQVPELLAKQWENLGKRRKQKVGVAADKFVSVGEDAEGIQIITDLLCSVKQVHFLRERLDRGLPKDYDICTECYGKLEAGNQHQLKDYLSVCEEQTVVFKWS